MKKKLIINCEETTSQSSYVYEQRTKGDCTDGSENCCSFSTQSFKDTLGGGDTDPIITESGEYFTLSD